MCEAHSDINGLNIRPLSGQINTYEWIYPLTDWLCGNAPCVKTVLTPFTQEKQQDKSAENE